MTYKTIGTDLSDNILTITLNRPEQLNAFDYLFVEECCDALDQADWDDDVRAIIFTGAGKAYCAGADLSEGDDAFDFAKRGVHTPKDASPLNPQGVVDFTHPAAQDAGGKLSMRIFESKKPVIGAINGAAYGIGVTMTLPMDIRLASTRAKFGFVFTKVGVVPEAASSWFLPRIIGISKALELVMGGKVMDAHEALEANLVRSVYEPEELLPAARALAKEITTGTAPVSVALSRQMLWKMLGADHPIEANKLDTRAIWGRGTSGDSAEGVRAFMEKREPNFPRKVSTDLPQISPWLDKRPYS